MAKNDYKQTLNLPKTDFPMAAKLVQREPEFRKRWDEMKIYEKIMAARRNGPKWILHDGPPYANGDVHLGTGQNKILKDIVVKFHSMRGDYSPFVPGWDCHGLPIEHKVVKDLGDRAASTPKTEIRAACRKFADKYIDIQRNQFKSLGVFGDWYKPYLTLDPEYELSIIEVFEELFKKGQVYRGRKTVHWCIHDKTALAEAELEYKDLESPSIHLAFEGAGDAEDLFVWTTTPWTLPGDVAVAAHPELEYSIVEYEHPKKGTRRGIVGRPLVEKLTPIYKIKRKVGNVMGEKLADRKYKHPLFGHECPIVMADYVAVSEGTGLVHTAPGHGSEDYLTGMKYGLPILCPVDEGGLMTEEAGKYKGLSVWKANPEITKDLLGDGTIVRSENFSHSYPCCWRCKQPVIFRATDQWFISIEKDNARQRALDAVKQTRWVPGWGEIRITSMLEQRPDWCISRQRSWGVPIPGFYCEKCGELSLNEKLLGAIKDLFRKEGADGWFARDAKEIIPAGTKCPKCGAQEFRKEEDIFDVWFESAASHRAVSMKHPELHFPVDLYLEGTDQHRGWFQVSLLASLLSNGQAPFKTVVTHGFLVDARTGDKLSKSGFLIPVDEAVKKVGADLIRLWISSIDFTGDLPSSWEILQERSDPYRKIRNTFRYMLASLNDFDPAKNAAKELQPLDAWARAELHQLIRHVTKAYDNYEFHRAYHRLYDFCVVRMSALYFDILKDRLYTWAPDDPARRSAQTVLNEILQALTRMFAPILCHTMEEVWQYLPGKKEEREESVHLAAWPEAAAEAPDPKWERIWAARSDVFREIEKLRAEKQIGKSQEAQVTLAVEDAEARDALAWLGEGLTEVLIVAGVAFADKPPAGAVAGTDLKGLHVKAEKSPHPKCARCWNLRDSVGRDKEHPDACARCVGVLRGQK